MKNKFLRISVTAITLIIFHTINFAQAPSLGTAANFVLFSTNGAVTNSGTSHLTGNVGTNNGATSGFGNVNGVMHTSDGATASAAGDLLTAYNQLNSIVATLSHAPLLGNGDTLNAGIYAIAGNASLNLNLTLDAKGDANAVFIFKIQGALSTSAAAQIILINGAQACNVFWKVEGLVSMASDTKMRGNVIANNAAIDMNTGVSLEGRAFSTTGAVSVHGVLAYTPTGCGSPLLTGPAAPDLGTTACFGLFSTSGSVINSGITHVMGDVGTNVGLTTGYNPLYVTGLIHPIPDLVTSACAADLLNVYNYLNTLAYDIELLYPAQFGNNLVLTPHTYLMNAATAFNDTLILNAEGNADAVFVIKINGALTTSTYATVVLINGAQAVNVYWKVEGAVNINDYSDFKGTVICNNGAISLTTGVKLEGRALTTTGALSTAAITTTMPVAGCFPLPLKLLYFNGKAIQKDVSLQWSTSQEQNTLKFEVERSMDGRNYITVGSVAASGTTTGDRTYSFTDANIAAAGSRVVYYRLRLKDADGRYTLSNIVALGINGNRAVVLLYPNPVSETAVLMIAVEKSERVTYTITDQAGRVLHRENKNIMAGSNTINVNVKELAGGVYNLNIQGALTKERIQFIKQ